MKFLPPELFQLNEKRTLNTISIGEGGHQLVVIDDVFRLSTGHIFVYGRPLLYG
tara:strand:- start:762 stop:923 length:162 start_codon:yes stop_codon:yes gene_type:complete